MTSSLNPAAIFRSVPKAITVNNVTRTAHIEYADRGKTVTDLLKDHPLVVTLRYYADRPDPDATPGNQLLGRDVVGNDIRYTHGKIRQVSLSLNVHARDDDDTLQALDLIDSYVELVLLWVQDTLPGIIEVVSDPTVNDLTFLEDGSERRQMDLVLRYKLSSTETVTTIETVEDPDLTLA